MSFRSRSAVAALASTIAACIALAGCVAQVDERTCCRGILCGYPPDKNGNCAGPNGESAESLDEPEADAGTTQTASQPEEQGATTVRRVDAELRRPVPYFGPQRRRSTNTIVRP